MGSSQVAASGQRARPQANPGCARLNGALEGPGPRPPPHLPPPTPLARPQTDRHSRKIDIAEFIAALFDGEHLARRNEALVGRGSNGRGLYTSLLIVYTPGSFSMYTIYFDVYPSIYTLYFDVYFLLLFEPGGGTACSGSAAGCWCLWSRTRGWVTVA
jgi:hypothetical protein